MNILVRDSLMNQNLRPKSADKVQVVCYLCGEIFTRSYKNIVRYCRLHGKQWYVDEDGYVMHKKTLYQRAVKMKMKEREFAEEHKYRKVWGGKKLRFVHRRN